MADEPFNAFVVAHGGALLRFAYLLCRDRARAEDLVQESLLKALRRWREHELPEQPEAYVRRIVVNEYLGWKRRRASAELVGLTDDDATQADGSDAQAERDLMWRLLGSLPPRSRVVLVLRYYEQLPDQEIAEHLGCAPGTVRSLAARAFATLRTDPQLAELQLGPTSTKEA
jgi:RNA polymerase sigma-70 factor (sigma-E family)